MATLSKLATDNFSINRVFFKPKYDWVTTMINSYQERNPYQNLTDKDLMYLENAFRPDSPIGKYVWNTYQSNKAVCDFLILTPFTPNHSGVSYSSNASSNNIVKFGIGLDNKFRVNPTFNTRIPELNNLYGTPRSMSNDDYFPYIG